MGATNIPTIKVEIAFSANTAGGALWDGSLWDTATWGDSVVWSDVSQYVMGFDTSFGRQNETDRFTAGSARLRLINLDGRFSADNPGGPYVSGGVTGVRPWRPARITATWSGVTYPIFYGYTTQFVDSYPSVNRAETTVSLADGLALLASHSGYQNRASVGGGETTGKRVHRLLNDAGSGQPRAIDDGTVTCQPTTLAANTLSEIQAVADTEGGVFYQDAAGNFVFSRSTGPIENARSNTSQDTWGDANGETNYESIEFSYAGELVYNVVNFSRTNGAVRQYKDNASISLTSGERSQTITGLWSEVDTQVDGVAQLYLSRFSAPEKRVRSVTFHPSANTTVWPNVLTRQVRDRVTVKRRPPTSAGAWTTSRQCLVDGVAHTFDARLNDWQTTFWLSSADAWSVTTGRWDTAAWDTATWFF